MRKYLLSFAFLGVIAAFTPASAQVGIGIGVGRGFGYGGGYGRPYGRRPQKKDQEPKFDPIIHVSLGYGYPNVDQYQLGNFYNYSQGPVTQTGPVTGSIDYQYSRTASIGLLVTHGQVSANYYDYGNLSGQPVFNGSLDNWSIMANFIRYIPAGKAITPYFRTALGVNIWNENYTDAGGNKLELTSNPSLLAYQIGIGARLNFSKNTGIFLEAGYGKYILHGGVSFSF